MSDFDDQLSNAIQKGRQKSRQVTQEAANQKMSKEEIKRLHSKYRLQLSDFIEERMKQLPNHFPGFRYETVYGERGWGAACYRDDAGRGRRDFYSRLELTVRPIGEYEVLDISVRGTVKNKEVMQRNFFQELEEADLKRFEETIQNWILSYAELFSAAA